MDCFFCFGLLVLRGVGVSKSNRCTLPLAFSFFSFSLSCSDAVTNNPNLSPLLSFSLKLVVVVLGLVPERVLERGLVLVLELAEVELEVGLEVPDADDDEVDAEVGVGRRREPRGDCK